MLKLLKGEKLMERSKPKGIFIILAAVVTLLIAGAVVYALQNANQAEEASTSSQNQSDTTTGSKDPASEAAPTPSERVSITFTDNGFEPEDITVKKGTIVTVTNQSSKSVQFSSDDHPSHRENTEMNLKTLNPGESESYTATTTGNWGYHDHIDDSQTGTVTVEE